jgi:hypothetical protein
MYHVILIKDRSFRYFDKEVKAVVNYLPDDPSKLISSHPTALQAIQACNCN